MTPITPETLAAYLDDALSDAETAHVEEELRRSESCRRQLQAMMQNRDRGEHSLGAVWRRARLTCPTREQWGNYLLGVLEKEQKDYFEFHLRTIACGYCQANLADLQAQQRETAPATHQRRRKFFASSAGLLKKK